MAGNKRGARGKGRGKGVPWSQSGGVASTFAGHGGSGSGFAPGGTGQNKIGKTTKGNGTPINIRTPGGDKGKVRQTGGVKRGTGLERTGGLGGRIKRVIHKVDPNY